MANVMRWRYGDTNPVTMPVDSADAVEIGDLMYLASGVAKPAFKIDDIGGAGPADLAAAQEQLHDGFIGVAMQYSPEGSTDPIRIATSGVFELNSASAVFELGDRVGADDNSGGDALENQQVIGVSSSAPELSIGRVAKRVPSAATKVFVELHSTVLRDGAQAVA
ncbi:MAG: DUF2190 family protein [Pirellulales bacterium]|nr:DUF2190 family protein [Pirellulales bacterium]